MSFKYKIGYKGELQTGECTIMKYPTIFTCFFLFCSSFTSAEDLDLLQDANSTGMIWAFDNEDVDSKEDQAFTETVDPVLNEITEEILVNKLKKDPESVAPPLIAYDQDSKELQDPPFQAEDFSFINNEQADQRWSTLWSIEEPISEKTSEKTLIDDSLPSFELSTTHPSTKSIEPIEENQEPFALEPGFLEESPEPNFWTLKEEHTPEPATATADQEDYAISVPVCCSVVECEVINQDFCKTLSSETITSATEDPFLENGKSTALFSSSSSFVPVDEILHCHGCKMKQEARLFWKGSYGMFDEPVHHLTMHYEHYHALDEQDARRVLVYAVESLLADLNQGKWPHPQLAHSFAPEDLSIQIFFDSFFGRYVDRSYVKVIQLDGGVVSMQTFNCCGIDRGCKTRQERYKDSVFHVLCELQYECLCSNEGCARTHGYGVAKSMKWESDPLHARMQARIEKKMPSSFQKYPVLIDCCNEEAAEAEKSTAQPKRSRAINQYI